MERIEGDDVKDSSDPSSSSPAPGHGRVSVKLRAAPCTPADIRTLAAASATVEKTQLSTLSPPPPPPHLKFAFPFVGGTECLWEVTRTGEGVSSFQAGDLAIPTVPRDPPGTAPETGTWRTTATLDSASLIRVPWGGGGAGSRGNGNVIGLDPDISGDVISPAVAAHVSASVATAIRILEDFSPKPLEKGDRVVFTGASSAVAQVPSRQIRATNNFAVMCERGAEGCVCMCVKHWLTIEYMAVEQSIVHSTFQDLFYVRYFLQSSCALPDMIALIQEADR